MDKVVSKLFVDKVIETKWLRVFSNGLFFALSLLIAFGVVSTVMLSALAGMAFGFSIYPPEKPFEYLAVTMALFSFMGGAAVLVLFLLEYLFKRKWFDIITFKTSKENKK